MTPLKDSEGDSVVSLFPDLGGFSDPITEVVELGSTNITTSHTLDSFDDRGVQRKRAFNAYTKTELADRVGLADSAALTTDNHTLKNLGAGTVALQDANMNPERVAWIEIRDISPVNKVVNDVCGLHRELRGGENRKTDRSNTERTEQQA